MYRIGTNETIYQSLLARTGAHIGCIAPEYKAHRSAVGSQKKQKKQYQSPLCSTMFVILVPFIKKDVTDCNVRARMHCL